MPHRAASIGDVRAKAPVGSSWITFCRRELREVEGHQVDNVGIRGALRQFCEYMHEVCVGFDVAGPTGEHQAVDHGACLGASNSVAEQPCGSAGANAPFILPILGRKLKSIIVGTRRMGTASR